jgi:aminomethyltransferase
MPVGLGARDSLRLEAGLCLYGHDLDETISPVEADLRWVVAAKYHRENTVQAHFPGAAIILDQLSNGVARIRRGFRPQGKVPVREGALIVDRDGKKAGIITSGGYGQTVGAPIAMGYLDTTGLDNSQYFVKIRNNTFELSCVELPFVKHRYSKN